MQVRGGGLKKDEESHITTHIHVVPMPNRGCDRHLGKAEIFLYKPRDQRVLST